MDSNNPLTDRPVRVSDREKIEVEPVLERSNFGWNPSHKKVRNFKWFKTAFGIFTGLIGATAIVSVIIIAFKIVESYS